MTPAPHALACVRGFSLVEVLIALFVMAVGVIGSTSLQGTALQTAQESSYQTAALQLATEMAQHLRALEQAAFLESAADVAFDFHSGSPDPALLPTQGCYQSACAASDFHALYLREWLHRLDQALPEARAKICQDAAPWNTARDSLDWGCTAGLAAEVVAPTVIKIGWRARQRAGLLASEQAQRLMFGPMIVVPVALGDDGLT